MRDQPLGADRNRRWVWCAAIAVAGFVATLITVPTTLGIMVPGTEIPGINPSLVDTSGNERVWRVWWRARDDLIDVEPQWLLTAALAVLLAVFLVALQAAVWYALAPESEQADHPA